MTPKTTKLIDLFALAAEHYGPDRVALVTYTRAAAAEAKQRLAARFGTTEQAFPYVGTIHAMCYRQLRGPHMVDGRHGRYKEFCQELQLEGQAEIDLAPDQVEGFWYFDTPSTDEALKFRALLGTARHKGVPIEAEAGDNHDPARLRYLAELYTAWKQREHLLDFEDLLDHGLQLTLPVRVLLVDECQDQSDLMWRVVEHWAEDVALAAYAADPWQALYQWIGGDPEHFVTRVRSGSGQLVPLGNSHRLTPGAAAYAKHILRDGGWTDVEDFLGTWRGVGEPDGAPRTTFYLARTHWLLQATEHELEDAGTPYADLRGYSKLTSADGRAFRTLMQLEEGGVVTASDLQRAVERAGGGRPLVRAAASLGDAVTHTVAVETLGILPDRLADRLQHSGYLRRVYDRHGMRGLVTPPQVHVGTVHCSPPGEPILTANRGYVPIDDLDEDDRLVSWHPDVPKALSVARGYEFERTALAHIGPLLTIGTAQSETTVTPNHMLRARYAPGAQDKYLVYLFRKGNWWRLGQTRMLRLTGTSAGIPRRMGNEVADDAWVLQVCDTRAEAAYWEAYYAICYGIPLSSFYATQGQHGRISSDLVASIYDEAANRVQDRVDSLFADCGLDPSLPYYSRGDHHTRSSRRSFPLAAVNLRPELFVMPVRGRWGLEWEPITDLKRTPYNGIVYDLEVTPYHHYVSGGLLVHNSAKGREADQVHLVTSWASLPARNRRTNAGVRSESCVAYVASSRHRQALDLVEGQPGIRYPFP